MAPHESVDDGDRLLAALQARAAAIHRAELARAGRRLGALAPDQRLAVDALLSAIVDRLLDAPTEAIAQLEREGRAGSCAARVRNVLGLA